jgi:hypothetical protein
LARQVRGSNQYRNPLVLMKTRTGLSHLGQHPHSGLRLPIVTT